METDSQKPMVIARKTTGDTDLLTFVEKSRRFLEMNEECTDCHVEVQKRDHWFVLHGRVDSHPVKSKLIGLVPRVDGAQWIVDKLHVQ